MRLVAIKRQHDCRAPRYEEIQAHRDHLSDLGNCPTVSLFAIWDNFLAVSGHIGRVRTLIADDEKRAVINVCSG
jgi:hypothetical protein